MSLTKTASTTLYSESLLRPLRKLDRLVFYAWQRLYQSHAIWHVCAGRCLVSFCGGGAGVLRNEGEMLVRPVLVERPVEVASGVGAGVAATGVG